jgi:L-lactate dehydrogenase complex protein LldG
MLAVAETGSLLVAETTLADRAVGMLAAAQVIMCPTDALVPSLDEAAPLLRAIAARPGGYATLITGPSRTADIERVLTIGVQGPAKVFALFVDELAAPEPARDSRR